MPQTLQVVIIKPSKYMADGSVERFRRGFMPNSTVPHIRSMVPSEIDHLGIETHAIDEYVYTDLQYLKLLKPAGNVRTLVALVGVQSHQFHIFVGVESFDRGTLVAANKKQNRPDAYHNIVSLCREHGIGSHFSNILGFPQDTEKSIHEHLEVLQSLSPNWASFYILCPIPGTEQYDGFLEEGLITERNLDRFDTTCLTWKHPNLSATRLSELLYECYRKFASLGHAIQNVRNVASQPGRKTLLDKLGSLTMSAFIRYCAWRRTHPMSGGVMRVRLDGVDDFMELRKRVYGFELAPLPQSLKLPATESRLGPTAGQTVTRINSQTLSNI